MIAFRDFAPQQTQQEGIFKTAAYETFETALTTANAWIQQEEVKVLNVETVVLPNIYASGEEGTVDVSLNTPTGIGTWHQFIRVWYEK